MANGHIPIRPVRPAGATHTVMWHGNEGDNETFVKGAVLIDDGAGLLDEAGADPQDLIVGIANEDANNDTNNVLISVIPALPNQVFEATIDTSAGVGTGTVAQTDLWARYGLTEDGDGIWYVDKNKIADDTETVVTVVKLVDPLTTVVGKVHFVFLNSVTAFTATRS